MQIGVGICVNDGDLDAGQGGQKGWSGWGPYAAVFGKNADRCGIITLLDEAAPSCEPGRDGQGHATTVQVRQRRGWPRSWANFSLF